MPVLERVLDEIRITLLVAKLQRVSGESDAALSNFPPSKKDFIRIGPHPHVVA